MSSIKFIWDGTELLVSTSGLDRVLIQYYLVYVKLLRTTIYKVLILFLVDPLLIVFNVDLISSCVYFLKLRLRKIRLFVSPTSLTVHLIHISMVWRA